MAEASEAARALKRLRRKAGISVREMAKQLNWTATRYQHYEDRFRKDNLPIELLQAVTPILQARGVTSDELRDLSRGAVEYVIGNLDATAKELTDQLIGPAAYSKEMLQVIIPKVAEVRDRLRGVVPATEPVPPGEELVFIPVYDVAAAAGDGTVVDDQHIAGRLAFRPHWLRSVTSARPEDLGVITVRGDSMFPTLVNGDTVLVDFTQRMPKRDGIYVIRYDDSVQVKRISIHPENLLLTVRSDNKDYSTYTDLKPDKLDIVGRVIWLGRRI